MVNKYVWVLGLNKDTGNREEFIRCDKNNAPFYSELYSGKGYNVKIFTSDEIEEIVEKEKRDRGNQ